MRRGDLVYDKADPRHVGIIVTTSITGKKRRLEQVAKIRWVETGWVSFRVPVRNLRRASLPLERATWLHNTINARLKGEQP